MDSEIFLSFFRAAFFSESKAEQETKETLPRKKPPLAFPSLREPMAAEDEAAQLAAAAALPLRERAKHKNWKARVAAFEDIATSAAAAGGSGGGAADEAGAFL